MMHGSSMSTRRNRSDDERVFWIFVVVVFFIVLLFLAVGVAYAQPVTVMDRSGSVRPDRVSCLILHGAQDPPEDYGDRPTWRI